MLQAKLLNGDMIAQDSMYHKNCLTSLYKKANNAQLDGNYSDSERQLHGIACIKETDVHLSDNNCLFKLSELNKLYC